MGAVGAKDWAGGFLDLTADLQDDSFVGNEPLTPEARSGYLGEYFSGAFFWSEGPESLRTTCKTVMKAVKQPA